MFVGPSLVSESVKLGQDVKCSITKARDDTMWTGCTSLVFTPSLLTLSNHTITALKGEPAISDGQNWKIVSIIIYSSRPVQNCPWVHCSMQGTPRNRSVKFCSYFTYIRQYCELQPSGAKNWPTSRQNHKYRETLFVYLHLNSLVLEKKWKKCKS